MVTRADMTGTRPVGAVDTARPAVAVGDTTQESYDRLNKYPLGKVFQAQILSRMNDGSFVVKVADLAVRMNLPAGTQVGDELDLILAATHPRPAFSLPAPAGTTTDTSLTKAGRLISQVLQEAQKQGAPTALVGKTPLVPSPATSPAQVATALKDTLAFSGLFYESHLSQWAHGERPLAELMREPQAKGSNPALVAAALRAGNTDTPATGPAAQPGANAQEPSDASHARLNTNTPVRMDGSDPSAEMMHAAPAATDASLPTNAPTAPAPEEAATDRPDNKPSPSNPSDAKTLPDAKTLTSESRPEISSSITQASDGLLTSNPDSTMRAETFDSEAVRMISLQLDTLEHRHVAWQGELWPGQPMEWEVTEESPKGKAGDTEKSWQSVVRFELPTLGTVSATIRLSGERLQIQVRTADETAASLLRAHGGELASALDAAGSRLDLLTVEHDESA